MCAFSTGSVVAITILQIIKTNRSAIFVRASIILAIWLHQKLLYLFYLLTLQNTQSTTINNSFIYYRFFFSLFFHYLQAPPPPPKSQQPHPKSATTQTPTQQPQISHNTNTNPSNNIELSTIKNNKFEWSNQFAYHKGNSQPCPKWGI